MRMRLLARLKRMSPRSTAASASRGGGGVPSRLNDVSYGNGTAWVGAVTALVAVGAVAAAAFRASPSSEQPPDDADLMRFVALQIDILRHLGKHQNLVSLHDVLYLKDETIMLTDLVEGGELFDYIVDMAYITLTGVHPFDPKGDRSDAEIVAEIAKGAYDGKTTRALNKWYKGLSAEAKGFLAQLLKPDPAERLTATQALQHSWLKGHTTSTEPLDSGHPQRLAAYQRLQQLRANILTVIMGVQHVKFAETPGRGKTGHNLISHRTSTLNMDMFKEAFALFDKDESGGIDREELQAMLLALGQHLSSSEVDSIMQQADTDGDEKISFTEFVSMMNQRLFRRGELTSGDLKAAFDIFDENHDGFISSAELEHMLHLLSKKSVSSDEIRKLIQAADKNGDGKIDYDEFCALMQQKLHAGKPDE
ncbi:hypothetical protein BBJ28_00012142 [Nothophytophthora sp. Chile5]|nr:hypothetical protein BBJ28_00012142 [Nothophytophthora sp. Chile5]